MRSTRVIVLVGLLLVAGMSADAEEVDTAALRDRVRSLLSDVSGLTERLAALGREVEALEKAHAAPAPDEVRGPDAPALPPFDPERWYAKDGLVWPLERAFEHACEIRVERVGTGEGSGTRASAGGLQTLKQGQQDFVFQEAVLGVEAPLEPSGRPIVTFELVVQSGSRIEMRALEFLATQYEILVDRTRFVRGLGTRGKSGPASVALVWKLPIAKFLDLIRSDDVAIVLGGKSTIRLTFPSATLEAMRDFATRLD